MGRQVGKSLMFTQVSMSPMHMTHLRALEQRLCIVHQRIGVRLGLCGLWISDESGRVIFHSYVDA